MPTNSEGGCPRITRGDPRADSVTGGEACQYPCSEKEGSHIRNSASTVLLGTQCHPLATREPSFHGRFDNAFQLIDLQLSIQRAARNAKRTGSLGEIAMSAIYRASNGCALRFFQTG